MRSAARSRLARRQRTGHPHDAWPVASRAGSRRCGAGGRGDAASRHDRQHCQRPPAADTPPAARYDAELEVQSVRLRRRLRSIHRGFGTWTPRRTSSSRASTCLDHARGFTTTAKWARVGATISRSASPHGLTRPEDASDSRSSRRGEQRRADGAALSTRGRRAARPCLRRCRRGRGDRRPDSRHRAHRRRAIDGEVPPARRGAAARRGAGLGPRVRLAAHLRNALERAAPEHIQHRRARAAERRAVRSGRRRDRQAQRKRSGHALGKRRRVTGSNAPESNSVGIGAVTGVRASALIRPRGHSDRRLDTRRRVSPENVLRSPP